MATDATTFALAFAAMFGLLAWYLWRLERGARRVEQRLEALRQQVEASTRTKNGSGPGKDP